MKTMLGSEVLLKRGDMAVRARDTADLRRVALALASRIGDPLRDRLCRFAWMCDHVPAKSLAGWKPLRAAVAHRLVVQGS